MVLRDRRHRHLRDVLNAQVNDRIRVGVVGGRRGEAVLESIDEDASCLRVILDKPPIPRHPFEIVLALPRPKMLRRVLRTCAEFGAPAIHLINSARVEKSYWQSPLLGEDRLREAVRAGQERSMDTVAPTVCLHPRFRPFVEDTLPGLSKGRPVLVMHPGDFEPLSVSVGGPAVVCIGPEGGFVPFEIDLLSAQGAQCRTLGTRVLSVDTAVNAALARGV